MFCAAKLANEVSVRTIRVRPEGPRSASLRAQSRYQVRTLVHAHHLATAEVAASALKLLGEAFNSDVLDTWFDVFSFRYQQGVKRTNLGDAGSLEHFKLLQNGTFS